MARAEAMPDPRMAEAISIVKSKRNADDRWLLDAKYDEALSLSVNETINASSRWNTLRSLRVFSWYEGPSSTNT